MLLLVKKLWNFEKVEIFSGKTLTNFLWEKLDFWLFFGGGGVSILFSTKTWHLLLYFHDIYIYQKKTKAALALKKKLGCGKKTLLKKTKTFFVWMWMSIIIAKQFQTFTTRNLQLTFS